MQRGAACRRGTRVCIAVLLAVSGLVACQRTNPATVSKQLAPLDTRVATLRSRAEFEAALAVAEERERFLIERHVAGWRSADSRRDIATLRRLCAMPDTARSRWKAAAAAAQLTIPEIDADLPAARLALQRWRALCVMYMGPESPEVATVLAQLAVVNERDGALWRAYQLDERALDMRRRALGPSHPDIAASMDHLSSVRKQSLGPNDTEVRTLCDQALAMRRQCLGADSHEVGMSLLRRANYRRGRREFPEALREFELAQATFARADGDSSRGVAEVLVDRGLTLGTIGRWAEAEPLLQQGLAIRKRLGGPSDELLALALNQTGVALRELGRLDEAEAMLREAAAVQEERWQTAKGIRMRMQRFTIAAYGDLALVALQQGRWTEAWVELERMWSRDTIDRAIERGEVAMSADPWADLLARVQHALPDSAALIGWLDSRWGGAVPDWPYWCFVIRKTGVPQWTRVTAPPATILPLRERIYRLAYALRATAEWPLQVASNDELESLGRDVYRLRMAPMEPALHGIRTLIITSPDMNYGAPIEALIDTTGTPLAERFVTVYSPSALLYACARERNPIRTEPRRWTGLLLANPASTGAGTVWDSLPPLRNAVDEIYSLAARLAHADVLVGDRASESALDAIARSGKLARYDFLHFASHVEYHDQWPSNSALVLAEARRESADSTAIEAVDGRLAANEVADSWHVRAQLVSLAACRGLSLRSSLADGPYGLGAAFLSAGARSLLVSTCAVDDEACKLFFERFGSLLFAPGRPRRDTATALRDARLWLRDYRAADGSRPYSNPAFWSGFVLVGWPD